MVSVPSVHLEIKIESGSDRKSERTRVREREREREREGKEEGVTFPSQGPHGQCVYSEERSLSYISSLSSATQSVEGCHQYHILNKHEYIMSFCLCNI